MYLFLRFWRGSWASSLCAYCSWLASYGNFCIGSDDMLVRADVDVDASSAVDSMIAGDMMTIE